MISGRRRFIASAAVLAIACAIAQQAAAAGMINLTFDDGWRSQYTNLSILRDVKATFYVISSKLNHQGYIDGYMTPAQVQNLNRRGHEIGCHTVTHPDLTDIPLARAKAEIVDCKTALQRLLSKRTIRTFSYPYGTYNDRIINMVRQAGFKTASSSDIGLNTAATNPYLLQVFTPVWTTPFSAFKAYIDEAVKTDSLGIIVFHRIDSTKGGDQYVNTPAMLRKVVAYLHNNNIRTVTISEGYSLLQTASPR